MIPSACIVIPQWLFAVVWGAIGTVGLYIIYREFVTPSAEYTVLLLSVGFNMATIGFICFAFGIAPYLPCFAVVV